MVEINDQPEREIEIQPPLEAPLDELHDENEEFGEMEGDGSGFLEQEDGSVLIQDDELDIPQQFDDNLAEQLSESVLEDLAVTLLDDIDRDKEARKKRDEQYEEGIRRTGSRG